MIGEECFTNLRQLNKVTFGNPGVETIGNSAFIACGLTEVTFPSTLKTIGNWAFSSNKLIKISFPEGLTTIGHGAFEGQLTNSNGMNVLDAMTVLELPSTLKSIGEKAFMNVADLKKVVCKASMPPTALELAFDASTTLYSLLQVPVTSVNAYKGANIWKDFQYISAIGASAVTEIYIHENSEPEYYTLSGTPVSASELIPGIYIKRNGLKSEKVIINR